MAEVWLARHHATAQLRALKLLNSNYQGIPEVEARFQNEGESKLVHPNIVRIYEVGQEGGSSFIAMEFVDGHDLENILNSRRGPLTVAESMDIGTQILAGLGFAHANGIIHRDIKPSNVLVDREGHAYVMDFGIAKVLSTGRMLTQINSRLGTPDYMSPEQIRNPRDVDSRSDIYSFGCLFYELLTGWPPFDRGEGFETEHDIKTAHVMRAPTPPMERKIGLPAQLNEITLKCLAKAKEDRPQSCDEVIAAIHAYRVASAAPPKPISSGTVVDVPLPRQETPVILPTQSIVDASKRSSTVVEGQAPPPAPVIRPQPPIQATMSIRQPHEPTGTFGFASLFVIAAGSLFLLIAGGIGGWAWYQKHPGQTTDNGNTAAHHSNTGGASTGSEKRPDDGTARNQAANSTPKNEQAAQEQAVNRPAEPDSAPITPVVPNPTDGTTQATGAIQVRTAPSSNKEPNTRTVPRVLGTQLTAASPSQNSGTLIWTGDANSVGRQVTIIRSNMSAIQGGSLAGTMFPAGPVHVQVRAPATATVLAPNAQTNYNSIQLFLARTGQQTIYIDWTKVAGQ